MAFDFASDNASPVHPKIMEVLAACNHGYAAPYGADELSARLNAVYSDLFEHETFVFPVSSGTAANGLALGALTPSYGTVFCHRLAHIMGSEAGAVEFYSGGARLIPLEGEQCKLTPGALKAALSGYGPAFPHQMKASAVSLTQATDRGTVYALDEIRALSDVAHDAGLKVHIDGARFANALVRLNCSPAEMSWKSGADAVSFGTTKNGTMMAEAVLVFDKAIAETMRFMHKRAGFLQSKMRFFTAQLIAYVENGLWLDNARRANGAAGRMAEWLSASDGINLAYPAETNQIFVHIPPAIMSAIRAAGLSFRPWAGSRPDLCRLVTSYADPEELLARVAQVLTRCQKDNLTA